MFRFIYILLFLTFLKVSYCSSPYYSIECNSKNCTMFMQTQSNPYSFCANETKCIINQYFQSYKTIRPNLFKKFKIYRNIFRPKSWIIETKDGGNIFAIINSYDFVKHVQVKYRFHYPLFPKLTNKFQNVKTEL